MTTRAWLFLALVAHFALLIPIYFLAQKSIRERRAEKGLLDTP
jgi:hypothetical protein